MKALFLWQRVGIHSQEFELKPEVQQFPMPDSMPDILYFSMTNEGKYIPINESSIGPVVIRPRPEGMIYLSLLGVIYKDATGEQKLW